MLFRTEMNMANKTNREHILEFFINNNHDYLENYDYILIDTNPSMSIININAFYVADKIILTSDVSTNSINLKHPCRSLKIDYIEDLHL